MGLVGYRRQYCQGQADTTLCGIPVSRALPYVPGRGSTIDHMGVLIPVCKESSYRFADTTLIMFEHSFPSRCLFDDHPTFNEVAFVVGLTGIPTTISNVKYFFIDSLTTEYLLL